MKMTIDSNNIYFPPTILFVLFMYRSGIYGVIKVELFQACQDVLTLLESICGRPGYSSSNFFLFSSHAVCEIIFFLIIMDAICMFYISLFEMSFYFLVSFYLLGA